MRLEDCCKNYFYIGPDILDWRKNSELYNAWTVFRLASYSTGVVPVLVALLYGIVALYGRVCVRKDLSPPEKKVNAIGEELLLHKISSDPISFVESTDHQLNEGDTASPGQGPLAEKRVSGG
jgi:hypothetical protein